MNPRRIILGIIGAAMLITAMTTYFAVGLTEDNAIFVGVCSKVGLVLLTIFLAWPSLEKSIDKAPTIINATMLGALVFIAIRPKLLPLIVGGVVLALVVHFGLRFIATKLGSK